MANLNKKVLIVEDDKNYLWILRQGLEAVGFPVVFAEDGEEGLKMTEEEKPDLILLDILMPKMDGLTMAKKMKEMGLVSHVIFLTNLKDEEHISQAIEIAKDTEYIVKSDLHVDQIIARVKAKLGIN